MPVQLINTTEWMERMYDKHICVIDVRSPSEYAHAHIPNARNLPLFTDEERAVVGTLYKQESREAAILEGLDVFGPKMRKMVETVEVWTGRTTRPDGQQVFIHCWRGGMRSMAVAWLLDLYGFSVSVLQGGYKAYRNWVLNQFTMPRPVEIIGGNTGAGKTRILHSIAKEGHYTIDLEGLAHHKGSAFGNIGMPPQPSQEMFENKLAHELFRHRHARVIWMEDESQRIGDVNLPSALWQQCIASKVYFLDIPFEFRLQNIIAEYGRLDRERLVNAVIRIRKRLGGLEAQKTIQYLIEDNITEAFRILLRYYDKFYEKSLTRKENPHQQIQYITTEEANPGRLAQHILSLWEASSKTLTS